MAIREWQSIKYCYCEHAAREVALEAQVVWPADLLPDQPARVFGHRCSSGLDCNLDGRASCMWAGTNPVFDPFKERMDSL